uniref:Nucleosome assembly protein 1,4 n=1 Tax=Tanacetum cinerariifolium TaxID=118510 RepID=A0A6L2NCL9_TANCI|nr:nucleosome assembly protein 1,4 [Tanacetum cinerariifolium]GEU95265.1 nucleosome assembly protein 1,4 [Tanacetum cinerariifolium]
MGLIAVAQGCCNLEYLHIQLTNISNEALECIGTNLKNLRALFLIVCKEEDDVETISPLDSGFRAMLIGCTKLEKLCINLYEEYLTDVGLGFIGKYGINLRSLSLARIEGSDEGLRALSKGCPRLRKFRMQGCDFSEQAITNFLLNVNSLRLRIKSIPIKVNVFAWKIFLDRLPTR